MSEALPLPSPDRLWSLEERVLALQQVTYRFFAEGDWIWAGKMLFRLDRMAQRLDAGRNPLEQAGRAFFSRRRPAAAAAPPPPSPKPEPEPEPEPPVPETNEELLAHFDAMIENINIDRARAKVPPLTWEQTLAWVAEKEGQDAADWLAEVRARRAAPPSG